MLGMALCQTVATAVAQFTGGQFFLEIDAGGGHLVSARTGDRLQIFEPEIAGVPSVERDERVVLTWLPSEDGRLAAVGKLSEHEARSVLHAWQRR